MRLESRQCAFLEVVKYKICVRTPAQCLIPINNLEGRLEELVIFEIHGW
jgi:hypothetical protein